jgi:short-subunit dehydrogenase
LTLDISHKLFLGFFCFSLIASSVYIFNDLLDLKYDRKHITKKNRPIASGTIAIISSIAGERGRASNYVYGSAKAMVTTFASGLRQRLHKFNVDVVTIKPGLIDTPMTASFKKGFLWKKPAFAAVKIVRAIDRRKNEVYVPAFWWLVMMVIKVIPNSIYNKLKL